MREGVKGASQAFGLRSRKDGVAASEDCGRCRPGSRRGEQQFGLRCEECNLSDAPEVRLCSSQDPGIWSSGRDLRSRCKLENHELETDI